MEALVEALCSVLAFVTLFVGEADKAVETGWLVMGLPVRSAHSARARDGYWRRFVEWSGKASGESRAPVDPELIVEFLEEQRLEGKSASVLRGYVWTFGSIHREEGWANPMDSDVVDRWLNDMVGMLELEPPRRARGIRLEELEAIERVACEPRDFGGGRMEAAPLARRRGLVDIALLWVMRDALLGRGAVVRLRWNEIDVGALGSGVVLLREHMGGKGELEYLNPRAMSALFLIKTGSGEELVFSCTPETVRNRVRSAALAAGLGEGFSGHSPRLGFAMELAEIWPEAGVFKRGDGSTVAAEDVSWEPRVVVDVAVARPLVRRYYEQSRVV